MALIRLILLASVTLLVSSASSDASTMQPAPTHATIRADHDAQDAALTSAVVLVAVLGVALATTLPNSQLARAVVTERVLRPRKVTRLTTSGTSPPA